MRDQLIVATSKAQYMETLERELSEISTAERAMANLKTPHSE